MTAKSWRVLIALGLGLLLVLILISGASGAVASATSQNELEWRIELDLGFTPAQMALPGWETQTAELTTALAARVSARGVRLETRRQLQNDGKLDYQFTLAGSGDLAQFKQVAFDDLQPLGGLLGGPADLSLTGELSQGETLPLVIESNPSTGYAWSVTQLDAQQLRRVNGSDFRSSAMLLGAPEKQTVRVQAVAAGRSTLVLSYRRPWQTDERPTRKITLSAERLSMLSDLGDPAAVTRVYASASDKHQAPTQKTTEAGLPSSFSWKDLGKLTPIRDQGSCGGCWAFSTVGAFEPALLIKTGQSTNLSEQYLISCNQNGWSCNGGWFAHDYHINRVGKNQTAAGAVLETAFPYSATNAPCTGPVDHPYRLNNWYYIGAVNGVPPVAAIKDAIYNHGPVSVAVCVGNAFQGYRGGVFGTNETCSGTVNHAVVLAGWNDVDGTWLLRNSWGTGWGESGYMRIKWGTSSVGFGANYVDYAQTQNACYSLNVGSNPGSGGSVAVSPAPNCSGTQYASGTAVTLTAKPNSGYVFSNWTGNANGASKKVTVVMDGDKNATANFSVASNLLRNPSFELDANGDHRPDSWSAGLKFTRSNAMVQEGSYAGRLYATNNSAVTVRQLVRGLGAGQTYNVSGWVNIPTTGDTFTLKLQATWRRVNGAAIKTDTIATLTGATGGWVQKSASLVAPSGTASAVVRIVTTNLNATIYLDNFSFSP